ncbi:MAG: LysR family transcriptional regulator, partial [Anaerolineales bacterium]|nr:LysR family transcriptional regulator [Anaerolineales bacterium]
MELRHLEAFVAVAHEGSFTNAAERLNLTQPSLSARVQQLEQALGTELFSRQTRPIGLTTTGQIFLPYAERVLSILAVGLDTVREAESGLAGRLTLGCPVSVATYLMPQIMETFNRRYPHVELSMETGYSATMVELLQDGVLDMTFTAVFPHLIRQCELLLHIHDELIAAVTTDHP